MHYLIVKSCFIKCCVYFAADLAVTCATDFHEKRYVHLDKYVLFQRNGTSQLMMDVKKD